MILGESARVVNQSLVTDPTIQQPGFNLPYWTWCALNHFRTDQRPVLQICITEAWRFLTSADVG